MINFEQAQRVGLSEEWQIVQKELDYRIAGLLSQLKTCSMDDLGATQLKLQVYEEIKRLPEDVKEREGE